MKGITREYTIWCSKCENWEQVSFADKDATYKNAIIQFKANGWKIKTKSGKHLCPNCKKLKSADFYEIPNQQNI